MLNYEEGLNQVRQIITNDPAEAHPTKLSDDLLRLVIHCYQDEDSNEIALPIMLVLHYCSNDKELMKDDDITDAIHRQFIVYRNECECELRRRKLNVISLQHSILKRMNKAC